MRKPHLEDLVIYYHIAKELKNYGVPQESLFYYARWRDEIVPVYRNDLLSRGIDLKECVAAFTSQELIKFIQSVNWLEVKMAYTDEWSTLVGRINPFIKHKYPNEAHTRSEVLLYMLRHKIISFRGITLYAA